MNALVACVHGTPWPPEGKIEAKNCTRPGSVVVEISNRAVACREGEESQAEQLAHLLPEGVMVVKALNTVSAYQVTGEYVLG